jgi:DNA invertase Pin-like site-specific DNA recombinase
MWQSRTVAVREDRRGPPNTGVGAVVDQASEWAAFDALLGIEVESAPDATVGALAFYGRCSTEDNQDPETSKAWQLSNAAKFVQPLGGVIVAEFFDIGQSRSVPWERRNAASRLLSELRNPDRGWTGLVVGEGTRCWFGNQFSLTAPRFEAYGLDLWVPELGGKFENRNPSHKMLMSVLGGMSESERQHVQARVRAAMDAQVVNEGRHQGGRAPYGYKVVDGGPHPNPRKAAEGYRLRVLAVDDPAAEVVRRIFAEYLDGLGDRAIASRLNGDAIPCPSASNPAQNRHRIADGWQGSTVRSILENPRYTGYAVFGRWTKHERLIDPDDVGAGHIVRFRRANPDQIVRSREPAHPAIVTVHDFVDVQLLRRFRGASGPQKLERGPRPTKQPYLFRGRIRCGFCLRRMEGSTRQTRTYYRCAARSIVPGAPALAHHPKNVYLPEAALVGPLNEWLAQLFNEVNLDATVASLTASQSIDRGRNAAQQRLHDAEARVRRLQAAIAAGVDPAALVEAINETQAQREAAQGELQHTAAPDAMSSEDIYALIKSLGEIAPLLNHADPALLAQLYQALRLEMTYDAEAKTVSVTIRPMRRASERVRGGT